MMRLSPSIVRSVRWIAASCLLLGVSAAPSLAEPVFLRGDSNNDGRINITDAVRTLRWLFQGGEEPPCLDAADADDDGRVNITDAIVTLNFLFTGGREPPLPGPFKPGPDPTSDTLSCAGSIDTVAPDFEFTFPRDGATIGIPEAILPAMRLFPQTFSAAGGFIGIATPTQLLVVGGEPFCGVTGNALLTLRSGYLFIEETPGRFQRTAVIAVEGTIDDPNARLTVNGRPASIREGRFRVEGIEVMEGENRLVGIATDLAGNRRQKTILVTVDLHRPSAPILNTPSAGRASDSGGGLLPPSTFLAPGSRITLGGTKEPGTSIWITLNGKERELVPLNGQTNWSVGVELVEGDNLITVVAKDGAGNVSATNTFTVILDKQPPVISDLALLGLDRRPLPADPRTGYFRTDFSSVILQGKVDDSGTAVAVVNSTLGRPFQGTRDHRSFEATVSLADGLNVLLVTATSPRGFQTSQEIRVAKNFSPTISSLIPDNAKVFAGSAVTFQAIADDRDNDPLEYRFLINGTPLGPWSASPTQSLQIEPDLFGLSTISVRVRDRFGGEANRESRVFVAVRPVFPPN